MTRGEMWAKSVDVRIIEIVLEIVEKVGIGELVIGGDNALAENLERVNFVDVHGDGRSWVLHLCEQVHRRRPHQITVYSARRLQSSVELANSFEAN